MSDHLKLFGDQEAPEWLAANVIRFSRFSEKSVKVFTEAVIDFLITGSLKYSQIQSYITSKDQISEIKAIFGSLSLILKNATKYSLTEAMLSADLQKLGLPYPYQLSICRPFSENKMELTRVLSSQSVLLSNDFSFDWNIEAVINDNGGRYICNNLSFQVSSPNGVFVIKDGKQQKVQECSFSLSESSYYRLSQELRRANDLMSLYSKSN